jgi:hypothetical protein
LALTTVALMGIPATGAAAAPASLAAFCQSHPNVDFPGRARGGPGYAHAAFPREVAAVGATKWRCMSGKVYVCNGGASGSACWKMNPSREPSKEVRETCEANPGQNFVAIAVIANSASTWRCRGAVPEIIATVPLDKRGFIRGAWSPLFNAQGRINRNIEFGVDPR